MDRTLRWYDMSVGEQISNIGSEVGRAIRYKNKGDEQKAAYFCNKAIEFFEIVKQDPKNKYRQGEFSFCIEELKDYFLGENYYGTTDEMLKKYYDAFLPV